MNGLLWEIFGPLVEALRPPKTGNHAAGRAKRPAAPKNRKPPINLSDNSVPLLPFDVSSKRERSSTRTVAAQARPRQPRRPGSESTNSADASMQAKYDAVVTMMLAQYQVRVRKWRTSMSGIAWYVTYRDGRKQRLIEAPRPKGPMSVAVFLHEIGHHAIGFDVYKPRCLEEYHAWRWALEAMETHGLNITDQVRLRVHRSLWYAVQKAQRRGIKRIPEELGPYLEKPSFARRRSAAPPGGRRAGA